MLGPLQECRFEIFHMNMTYHAWLQYIPRWSLINFHSRPSTDEEACKECLDAVNFGRMMVDYGVYASSSAVCGYLPWVLLIKNFLGMVLVELYLQTYLHLAHMQTIFQF